MIKKIIIKIFPHSSLFSFRSTVSLYIEPPPPTTITTTTRFVLISLLSIFFPSTLSLSLTQVLNSQPSTPPPSVLIFLLSIIFLSSQLSISLMLSYVGLFAVLLENFREGGAVDRRTATVLVSHDNNSACGARPRAANGRWRRSSRLAAAVANRRREAAVPLAMKMAVLLAVGGENVGLRRISERRGGSRIWGCRVLPWNFSKFQRDGDEKGRAPPRLQRRGRSGDDGRRGDWEEDGFWYLLLYIRKKR